MNGTLSFIVALFRSGCAHLISIIASLLIAALPGSTIADEADAPQVTPETVIRYLQQDVFISPGIGFQKVRIGDAFDQVAKTWGNPNKAYDSDVGSKTAWVYFLGRGSEIALSGGTKVDSIEVTGSFNSPFSSIEGASFGMTPHQVISIYGKPADEGNLSKLRYPKKGIAFGFKSGALHSIRVFPSGR